MKNLPPKKEMGKKRGGKKTPKKGLKKPLGKKGIGTPKEPLRISQNFPKVRNGRKGK